jgi:hypothetical protein
MRSPLPADDKRLPGRCALNMAGPESLIEQAWRSITRTARSLSSYL